MKELIKKTLESYKGTQLNIDSDTAIAILVDEIEAKVKNEYHIFKINKLIVEERNKKNDNK